MNCHWINCNRQAEYILVYGCLDGHIDETYHCTTHALQAIMGIDEHSLSCKDCDLPLESYEARDVRSLLLKS